MTYLTMERCGSCKQWFPDLNSVFSHDCDGSPAIPATFGPVVSAGTIPAAAPVADGPTDKQVSFLRKLIAQKIGQDNAAEHMLALQQGDWTKRSVSTEIDRLMNMAAPAAPAPVAKKADPEDGFYISDTDIVFKVQTSKTGNKYAKELNPNDGTWAYVGRAPFNGTLSPLTLEKAKAWGLNTIRCCICGRQLDNPESRAAGIGPVCASRNF